MDDDGDSNKSAMSAYLVLFALLMSIVVVLAKLLHERPRLAAVLPEAGMFILCGMTAGLLVNLISFTLSANPNTSADASGKHNLSESLLSFSSDVFFVGLLPPIIFNSGYHLRRELFVRHFQPICMFAVLGTAISTVSIAGILHLATVLGLTGSFQPSLAELLTFGALISATDPVSTLAVFEVKRVDPQLFYLVFGESVLNDAVGLVFFQNFAKLLMPENEQKSTLTLAQSFIIDFTWDAIGSPILGILCGVSLAFLFKSIDMRQNMVLELSLYVFITTVPYMLGEILGLSGIVVILFTGISARAYVVPNLSAVTEINADLLFRLVAFLAETAIFLELGLSVFGLTGSFHLHFILWALLACLIGRACGVYPLTVIYNWSIQRKIGVDRSLAEEQEEEESQRKIFMKITEPNEKTSLVSTGKRNDALPQISSVSSSSKMLYKSNSTPMERGDLKILPNCAHMLWFAGLRGAVAYACAMKFPNTRGNHDSFVMTTMMIVLVTVFGLGATTTKALNFLGIETSVDEDEYMDNWSKERSMPGFILRFEDFIEQHATRSPEEQALPIDCKDDNPSHILHNKRAGIAFEQSPGMALSRDDEGGCNNNCRRASTGNNHCRRASVRVRWEGHGLYDYGQD